MQAAYTAATPMTKPHDIALLLVLAVFPASAGSIVETLPEVNGPEQASGFPGPTTVFGTFNFSIPAGETIVTAVLNGQWGNSTVNDTAHHRIFADGGLIANTATATLDPFYNTVPWSFVFTDFTSLLDGSLTMTYIQDSRINVRLGETTLTIRTAPGTVPDVTGLSSLFLAGAIIGGIRMRLAKKA